MAEVRLCFGRGTYGFGHRICNHNLLGSHRKPRKSVRKASRLSPRVLFADIQHGGLCGAESPVDSVTVELFQSSYARGASPYAAARDVGEELNVSSSNALSNRVQRLEGLFYEPNGAFERTLRRRSFDRHLSWKHAQMLLVRSYSGSGTRSEPLYKTKTGYYEILEVAPTATQAQIKTAYYKQSFIFHPDRNCGSEVATTRFSEISEAYTVLGSKALRKKYDRGLLSPSDLSATARPPGKDTPGSPTKQHRGSRRPAAGYDFREGVFDFDTFYKSHYNEQLQRQRDVRVRKEEMLKRQKESKSEKELSRMMEVGVGMLLVTGLWILMSLKRD